MRIICQASRHARGYPPPSGTVLLLALSDDTLTVRELPGYQDARTTRV
jgi:hypothetical protein